MTTLNEAQERIVYYAKVDVEAADPAERTKKLYGKTCRLAESGVDLPTIKEHLLKIAKELEIPETLATNSINAAFERMVKEGKVGEKVAAASKPGDVMEF